MTSSSPAELLLRGGRVTTLASDGTPEEASSVAVRSGHVAWVGDDADADGWIGPDTRVVDLGGRRVIPGLIDAHVHFVRAGLTWNDEVRWGTVTRLEDGLQAIADRAAATPAGTWIRVVGGWHPSQFEEGRHPTREELDAVAPDHPVLVQFLYEWGMLNGAAMSLIDWSTANAANVDPATVDTDENGAPLGVVRTLPSLRWLHSQFPHPALADQVDSTIEASRVFSSFGITGLIDGGGANTGPDRYDAVWETWRRGQLGVRVRLTQHATAPGTEDEEVAGYLRYSHPDQGDERLRLLGLGEIPYWAMHDGFERVADISSQAQEELTSILHQCAERRWTMQMHIIRPETLEVVLDLFERVHAEHPIDGLRWGIVHGQGVRGTHVERLRALGVGILSEALLRLEGDEVTEHWGAEALEWAPPIRELRSNGIPVTVGSDALRVASYNPFATLQWLVTGRSLSGTQVWHPDNVLSKREALELLTVEAAWFSFEEERRGRLQPGYLADIAVLDQDYFDVDPAQLPDIRSWLTLVDGEVTWSADDSVPITGIRTTEARGRGRHST